MRGVTQHTLDNGLRVYHKKKRTYRTAIAIGARMGAADESMAEAGASHFAEHMLFKGNKHRTAREIAIDLEDYGANANAYTSESVMTSWVLADKAAIPLSVEIFAQAWRNERHKKKEFETEREVVLTELDNYINIPERYAFEFLFSQALYAGTTLGKHVLGTRDALTGFTPRSLARFKLKYASPKNMVVVAVGDVKDSDLVKAVEKHFGRLEPYDVPRRDISAPRNRETQVVEHREGISQCFLCLGHVWPAREHPDYVGLRTLNNVLSGGGSSRIFTELREKRGIGYSVGTLLSPQPGSSIFAAYIDGFDPARFTEAYDTVLDVLEGIKREPVGEDELRRAKVLLISDIKDSLESGNATCDGLLTASLEGRIYDPRKVIRAIGKVTAEDIQRLANTYLTSLRTETLLAPQEFKAPDCWVSAEHVRA